MYAAGDPACSPAKSEAAGPGRADLAVHRAPSRAAWGQEAAEAPLLLQHPRGGPGCSCAMPARVLVESRSEILTCLHRHGLCTCKRCCPGENDHTGLQISPPAAEDEQALLLGQLPPHQQQPSHHEAWISGVHSTWSCVRVNQSIHPSSTWPLTWTRPWMVKCAWLLHDAGEGEHGPPASHLRLPHSCRPAPGGHRSCVEAGPGAPAHRAGLRLPRVCDFLCLLHRAWLPRWSAPRLLCSNCGRGLSRPCMPKMGRLGKSLLGEPCSSRCRVGLPWSGGPA